MAEYWKSTPTYWCKFCSQYVRDTAIEKKNHESSGKHQNNIQRSLRELHKKNDREERDKQRAKAEVERVNGIVSGKKSGSGGVKIEGLKDLGGSKAVAAPSEKSAALQRKQHAEQLAALGVHLPDELKKEVTGVGGWQVVSERVIEDHQPAERAMADIMKEEHEGGVKVEGGVAHSRGVHKRKAENEEDEEERAAAKLRRKAWGSRIKTYPGEDDAEDGEQDLDALLSGVTANKPKPEASKEDAEEIVDAEDVSTKQESVQPTASDAVDDEDGLVKEEVGADKIDAPPVVFFKKRKAKR